MNYFLKLEYNAKNILIVTLEKDASDVAMIVYEDLNREEIIDVDFPYLKSQLGEDPEYKDSRNLISIMIFPLFDRVRDKRLMEEVEAIAEYFVGHRGMMNTKINWVSDKKVTDLYKGIDDNKGKLLEYLFTFCENKREGTRASNYDFSHLNQ